MMFYEDRLTTFEHWSKQINPDKYRLAKAGFYYTGQADAVTCFSCNQTVSDWEPNDDPWNEHYKWSKQCVFLKMTGYEASLDVIDKPVFGTTTFGQQRATDSTFVKRWSEFSPKPAWLGSTVSTKSEQKGFTPPVFTTAPVPFGSQTTHSGLFGKCM